MNTKGIIEGMTILFKYYKDENGFNVGAEHDEIWMFAPDLPISDKDKDRLMKLGWVIESGAWMAFV
jgi:hypothetical protein